MADDKSGNDRTKKKKKRCPFGSICEFWRFLKPWLLILWDGMGFFGFDDTKLARLKGKPLTFFSKFTSARWTIISVASLIGAFTVLILEASKYGDIRNYV